MLTMSDHESSVDLQDNGTLSINMSNVNEQAVHLKVLNSLLSDEKARISRG